MKRELRRIEPWSAVRVGFFFGLIAGFLFGLLNAAIIKYFAGIMGDQAIPKDMMNLVNLSGGAIVALAIVSSLIFSLMGSVCGAIAAMCYNLIASLFGGVEISLSEDEQAPAAERRRDDEKD